ncbi:hypothetical protein D046_3860A, partial [Vibrio parahaemolyticus V-223/04]
MFRLTVHTDIFLNV